MSFADAMRGAGYGTDPAGDAARRVAMGAATVTPEELARLRTGADDPVPPDPDPVNGHALTRERSGSAWIVRCECGRWDGGWTGPRARRRVLDDYAAHVAAELAAAAPLHVTSERADQRKELE